MLGRDQVGVKMGMRPVGVVRRSGDGVFLEIGPDYRPGLKGLEAFSHAQVLWWFDRADRPEVRSALQVDPPFPAPTLGVFALKAPARPNPIAVSTVTILSIDMASGRVTVPRIDAYDGTPIVDIKPYIPAFDRVKNPLVPDWAATWPEWLPDEGIELDTSP